MTSHQLHLQVLAKYPAPVYVVLGEVREFTGYGNARSADAMAFGVWPSRGLEIVGFEYKSARADWLHELKQPEKSDAIARYCDKWWLVSAPDVAKLEEVPPAWGWYEAGPKGLKALKPCPEKPRLEAIGRGLLLSIVRRMNESCVPKAEVAARAQEMAESAAKMRYDHNESQARRAGELQKVLNDFQKATGINLENYSWQEKLTNEVGAVVNAVLDHRLPYQVEQIADLAANMDAVVAKILDLPFFSAAKQEAKARKKLREENRRKLLERQEAQLP